jgi:hypothetical protein
LRVSRLVPAALAAVLVAGCGGGDVPVPLADGETPTYERHIAPLFAEHCTDCHGAFAAVEGGWDATDYELVLTSGDGGPAVIAGDPDASRVVRMMRGEDEVMPPKGRLSEEARVLVEGWIRTGAPEG